MIDPLPRFQAVQSEIDNAFARAGSIIDFINTQQPSPEIRVGILNNLIVSLVSIAEEGLRIHFIEYISILEEGIHKYSDLRKDLLEANIRGAASLLTRSIADRRQSDPAVVAAELLKCLTNENGFKLFKDEIAFNRYNLRPREIKELAKRVGIPKIWELVRATTIMKDYFPDLDEVEIEQNIIQKWTALFDERDTIVHRFSEAQGWGDTIIRAYISFLSSVTQSISHCLANDAVQIMTIADLKLEEEQASTLY